jgi:hypothetical protein
MNKQDKKMNKIPNKNNKTRPFEGINDILLSSNNSIILKRYKSGTLFNAIIVCICVEHKFNEPKIPNKCRPPVTTNKV